LGQCGRDSHVSERFVVSAYKYCVPHREKSKESELLTYILKYTTIGRLFRRFFPKQF
jgi:hypothetical protein